MGSPSYMSPEQVRGLPLDPRSDLFSAAVVVYEMLAGERPFAGDDVATTMYRIVNEPPRQLEDVNPTISSAVSEVLVRALSKTPADRYQTGAEFVAALRQAASLPTLPGVPVLPPAGLPPAGPAPARSRVRLVIGGLAAVLALLVVAAMLGGGPPPPSTPSAPSAMTVPPGPSSPAGAPGGAAPPGTEAAPGVVVRLPETAPAAPALAGPLSTVPPPIGVPGGASPGAGPTPATPGRAGVPPVAPGDRERVDALRRRSAEVLPAPPGAGGQTRLGVPQGGRQVDVHADTDVHEPPPPPRVVAVQPPPVSSPRLLATLTADFPGTPYAVTLFSDGRRLGRVEGPGAGITVEPGSLKLRAVNESIFLDVDMGAVDVGPNERMVLAMPGTASAVLGVRGDEYAGVRISVDGRTVPGPYPAQLARIASGSHLITYRWTGGARADLEIAQTVTLNAGAHYVVRAVPDNGQLVVQQVR